MTTPKRGNASLWNWIPTVYLAEGLPYFAVNTLTVLMYTNMGMSKRQMAFLTGWLYLPWVIKPFWSPFVDLFRTKRYWVLAMQLAIAVAAAGIALALTTQVWLALTLTFFWIMAFASATHDISADGLYIIALDEQQQAAYVGVRSTFYRIASVLGQGGLVMLAGWLETSVGDVPQAWSLTFGLLSLFFFMLFFWHMRVLPRSAADHAVGGVTARSIVSNFLLTFVTFFRKPGIVQAVLFMLLYRMPEALCVKLVQPFLKDSHAMGGLQLTTSQIGFANGTVGVIALLAGGVLGGLVIARGGLRRWMWPMALSLTLPCVVYCYLAAIQPESFILTATLIGIEQFGYGFGFTSFMLYMMYFSRGESSTSHYAFCTAFMALGMMLPGMLAGVIFEWFETSEWISSAGSLMSCIAPQDAAASMGYAGFFMFVMLTTLVTFAVTFSVWRNLDKSAH